MPDAGPRSGPAGCVRELVAGHRQFCAIRFDGTVACWGMNAGGQLGTGTGLPGFYDAPTEIPLSGVRGVAPGGRHTCFLLDDGSMRCAGAGNRGQLGNGVMASSTSLVDVTVIGTANEVHSGPQHTCAIAGSELMCWGCTSYIGAANCGTADPVARPRSLAAMPVHVETNYRHTCVLLDDGRVGCFGQNFNGELGGGANPEPGIIYPAVANVTALAVGQRHTCVVTGGIVSCFGFDGFGQLGNGPAGSGRTPVPVAGLSEVVSIDAGQSYTCAVTATGEVWCWGRDDGGQIGGATNLDQHLPVRVITAPALQVAASRSTACALTTAGITCWGDDADGQLGNGPPRSAMRTPIPVDVPFACP
jgi:alpha-tubulin suppressor-like RCC1 family protein